MSHGHYLQVLGRLMGKVPAGSKVEGQAAVVVDSLRVGTAGNCRLGTAADDSDSHHELRNRHRGEPLEWKHQGGRGDPAREREDFSRETEFSCLTLAGQLSCQPLHGLPSYLTLAGLPYLDRVQKGLQRLLAHTRQGVRRPCLSEVQPLDTLERKARRKR